MKIIALNVGRLVNAKHINFMLFVKTGISKFLVIGERFATVVESFLAAYDNENDVYLKHTNKFLTEEIGNADTLRNNAFRRLRDVLKSVLLGQDEAQKSAAQRLLEVIDLYGGTDIPGMAVDAKSGVLTNLVEDFELEYPTLVTLTSTGQLLANLKAANSEYLRLLSDRTEHVADYGRDAVMKARRKTDQAYRNLVNSINIAIDNGMAAALSPFTRYLNAEIDRYRIQLGQSVGSSSGSEEEDSEGDGVVMKTATFKFVGGRTESFPVEVGTVLIAPTNTEGYKWSPEVPEVMPATNKTFREVPIVAEEATATFHFFDHTEEEVRQIVGTALVAPENTEGYHWEPEVPEVMPAEDTNYYELPDENNSDEGGDPNENNGGTGSGGGNNGGTGNNPSTPTPDPDDDDEIPEGDDPWRMGSEK